MSNTLLQWFLCLDLESWVQIRGVCDKKMCMAVTDNNTISDRVCRLDNHTLSEQSRKVTLNQMQRAPQSEGDQNADDHVYVE